MNRAALMLAFLAVHLTACAAVIPARVRERPPTAAQLLRVVSAQDDDLMKGIIRKVKSVTGLLLGFAASDLAVPIGLFDLNTVTPTEVTAPLVRLLTLDRADLAAILLTEGDSSVLVLIDLFLKLVLGALRSWRMDGKSTTVLLFFSATCTQELLRWPARSSWLLVQKAHNYFYSVTSFFRGGVWFGISQSLYVTCLMCTFSEVVEAAPPQWGRGPAPGVVRAGILGRVRRGPMDDDFSPTRSPSTASIFSEFTARSMDDSSDGASPLRSPSPLAVRFSGCDGDGPSGREIFRGKGFLGGRAFSPAAVAAAPAQPPSSRSRSRSPRGGGSAAPPVYPWWAPTTPTPPASPGVLAFNTVGTPGYTPGASPLSGVLSPGSWGDMSDSDFERLIRTPERTV